LATVTDEILKELLTLSASERAKLAECLLESLEPANEVIRQLWTEEAERRIDAYELGDLKAVPAEEVFARLRLKFSQQG
jgi:putative addiction module component (TIGR02574 family)